MNSILDFLNQPIVLTLITLAAGSYLLDLITERRARAAKLRDKAVEFLIEAGNIIGRFQPHVYKQLRTGRVEVDQDLSDAMKELFSQRMNIQIGSQAFLKSEDFYRQYHRLLDELAGVVTCMTELSQGLPAEEVVMKIQQNSQRLIQSWPLAGETLDPSTGRPVDELIIWMDVIYHRITQLLSSSMKSALR